MNVPIIRGRGPNLDAVKMCKQLLAELEKGTVVSFMAVAERLDSTTMALVAVPPEDLPKMRGALATLGTTVDMRIMGVVAR